MPRTVRPKMRVEHLADTIHCLEGAHKALGEIDLRTCRGELRTQVKNCRANTVSALNAAYAAIQEDTPSPHLRSA